ncbi:MAG TPA: AsmA-like C-terminal region-containing protein, partial [Kiloniellales bacterium]|nr:AsmA-like C-terminal region-containing protein [Kiloniellales bacterium]
SLTYRGVALGDLRLDATLAQGALTVREARVGNLSGGSARFAGKLDDLSTAPQVDGTVALEVGDPVRVARLAGIEGDLPARIGAFELGGTVSGGAQELGFDLELAALDGNFGFAGSAAALAAPPSFDLRVSAQHGDLAGLLRALAPDLALGSGLGGLEITARAAGNPAAITVSELSGTIGPAEATGGFALALDQSGPVAHDVGLDLAIRHSDLGALAQSLAPQSGLQPGLGALDLESRVTGSSESLQIADLSGRAGPAELSGSLGLALAGPTPGLTQLELDVALRHEDLAALARRLNPGLALAPGLGGVDLGARVTGEQNRFEVTDLSGTLGPTELSGRLGLDLSGAKPSLSADLTTGVLPAAGLLAPAAVGGKTDTSSPAPARDSAGRWSREPIDVSALDALNADVKLTSEALVFDKTRLDKATVNLGLLDGILDLRKLSGTLFGGALSVTGKVDTRASLDVGVAVTAIELDLARLLRTVAETDRVSGPLDINATLSAHGESEAELVSSLSGDGEISGTLTVKAKAEEQVGSMLLGILGERVREIRAVTDATNLLFNAFAGTPAAVQGTFRVENGVVRTEDTLVRGKQARAVTRGNADLPRWLLDTTTDLYREGESGTPYLTVDLAGPLDSPNPRLRGQVLQRQPTPQVAPSG